MAGLLSGLSRLGLGNLENMELYEQPEKEAAAEEEKAPAWQEEDFLFDKSYECPVCDKPFKARTVRAGKLHSLGTDRDLRPMYEQLEPLKYDVVLCPHCGYATLTRFFGGLTSQQIKAVKETICAGFQPVTETPATYTYEEALERYKICLANVIVRHGRNSEKAYVCLKAGWLLRSQQETAAADGSASSAELAAMKEQEREFLKNALEGFVAARQSESFPICGMDELTLEYLIAVLAMDFDQDAIASRLISNLLASPSANARIKDKARDLKDELREKMKKK